MEHTDSERPVRRTGRRSPEEAQAEILEAAERFLWDRPFRDLTVGTLMAGTTIGRSAFYAYFDDRYHLVTELLGRLESKLQEASRPWLEGSGDAVQDVDTALRGVVAVWAEHGPVLRAIAEASTQDPRVEEVYRWGLLQRFIEAIAARVSEEQRAGVVSGDLDSGEAAAALVLMNERYLVDRMGRVPQADPRQVTATLTRIWTTTLYATSA